MERLQKVIANKGYTSRRKAEMLIKEGKVKVNGIVIDTLGIKVGIKDEIEVNGITLTQEPLVYYILNKPRGYISSTSDDKQRKTVIELIKSEYRIYPIGRLDYDTTGLLLLTNDGEFANLMMHPKHEINKVYMAKIEGIIDGFSIKKIKEGVLIDGLKTAEAKVKLKKVDKIKQTSLVEVTIHEGHNHQIKKMFESVGFNVIKLKRTQFGTLDLKGLQTGEYRLLHPKEIKELYNLSKNS